MENKPINKEAYAYVRLYAKEEISLHEFILVEYYVAEKHRSLYPDGILGDVELLNYLLAKLEGMKTDISPDKIATIVNLLYDFMFDAGNLLSITSSIKVDEWKRWRNTLNVGISNFISLYSLVPNLIHLSSFTKSQIELVSGEISISTYYWNTSSLSFTINDRLEDRVMILEHEADDESDSNILQIPEDIVMNGLLG